jgi:hypothetical protein
VIGIVAGAVAASVGSLMVVVMMMRELILDGIDFELLPVLHLIVQVSWQMGALLLEGLLVVVCSLAEEEVQPDTDSTLLLAGGP